MVLVFRGYDHRIIFILGFNRYIKAIITNFGQHLSLRGAPIHSKHDRKQWQCAEMTGLAVY